MNITFRLTSVQMTSGLRINIRINEGPLYCIVVLAELAG